MEGPQIFEWLNGRLFGETKHARAGSLRVIKCQEDFSSAASIQVGAWRSNVERPCISSTLLAVAVLNCCAAAAHPPTLDVSRSVQIPRIGYNFVKPPKSFLFNDYATLTHHNS